MHFKELNMKHNNRNKKRWDFMQNLLLEIFYYVDNFCIMLENYCQNHFLAENNDSNFAMFKSKTLSLSEVMIITIYFHLSNHRTFKSYHNNHVSIVIKPYFPSLID